MMNFFFPHSFFQLTFYAGSSYYYPNAQLMMPTNSGNGGTNGAVLLAQQLQRPGVGGGGGNKYSTTYHKKRRPSYGRRRKRSSSSPTPPQTARTGRDGRRLGQLFEDNSGSFPEATAPQLLDYESMLKFAESYVKLNDNYLVGSYIWFTFLGMRPLVLTPYIAYWSSDSACSLNSLWWL